MHSTSALIELARDHHGVFTVAEARDLDISDDVVARMVRSGEVVRQHPGVYRYSAVAVTAIQRLYAAVRAAERPHRLAFASHTSAGMLLGVPGVPPGRPEITVTGTSLPLLDGVRVHRSLDVAPGDLTVVARMPCSVGSRAVCECVGRLSERRRIALIDDAICQRITTREALHKRALRSPRLPGRATIIAVTRPGAEGPFWSGLERCMACGVRREGLPTPRYNVTLEVRGRRRIVDALFDPGVAVDVHGLRFHSSPDQVRADAERLNLATEAGIPTLVFTWDQVMYDFAAVAEQIRATIRRAQQGWPPL